MTKPAESLTAFRGFCATGKTVGSTGTAAPGLAGSVADGLRRSGHRGIAGARIGLVAEALEGAMRIVEIGVARRNGQNLRSGKRPQRAGRAELADGEGRRGGERAGHTEEGGAGQEGE